MKTTALKIVRNKELPPIQGRGRKKLSGPNLQLILKMEIGDSIWDVPLKAKDSIRTSAHKAGFKMVVRRIPGTNLYAMKRTQ